MCGISNIGYVRIYVYYVNKSTYKNIFKIYIRNHEGTTEPKITTFSLVGKLVQTNGTTKYSPTHTL